MFKKLFGVLITMSLICSVSFAEAAEQGQWYPVASAPRDAPIPPCGKKPKDAEYEPMVLKAPTGEYVRCEWSYTGPKISGWYPGFRDCFLNPMPYYQCLANPGYGSTYAPGGYNLPSNPGAAYVNGMRGNGYGYTPPYQPYPQGQGQTQVLSNREAAYNMGRCGRPVC